MSDLRETRRKLKIALAFLLGVDVAAVAILFSPLVGSQLARRQQMADLWKELQLKTHQVQPLRGLDKKIVVARQQIDNFYKERLPDRDSAVAEALGRLAAQTGVKIEHIKYSPKETQAAGLSALDVEANLSGNYLQLVKFINSLEREQVFFIVDSVDLGGEQAGIVRLQIKLESYLKSGMA
jgi:Tfp pilus assembly protein PilO